MCELNEDHNISPCTRGHAYDCLRPASVDCSLVVELKDEIIELKMRVRTLEAERATHEDRPNNQL